MYRNPILLRRRSICTVHRPTNFKHHLLLWHRPQVFVDGVIVRLWIIGPLFIFVIPLLSILMWVVLVGFVWEASQFDTFLTVMTYLGEVLIPGISKAALDTIALRGVWSAVRSSRELLRRGRLKAWSEKVLVNETGSSDFRTANPQHNLVSTIKIYL